jgi:hypothetical protein
LRVFNIGECFLLVHAFSVSQYEYLISGALKAELEYSDMLVKDIAAVSGVKADNRQISKLA